MRIGSFGLVREEELPARSAVLGRIRTCNLLIRSHYQPFHDHRTVHFRDFPAAADVRPCALKSGQVVTHFVTHRDPADAAQREAG
jgi:hypothetical protein